MISGNSAVLGQIIYNNGSIAFVNLIYINGSIKDVRINQIINLFASLAYDMNNSVT